MAPRERRLSAVVLDRAPYPVDGQRERIRLAVLGLLAFAGSLLPMSAQAQEAPRAFTPADVLAIETIGEVVPAPAGDAVAIVVLRARSSSAAPPRFLLGGADRADIWVSMGPTAAPVRMTDGAADGAGFYSPSWSPDGQRLAFLSTRDGHITLWLWDRTTQQARQVMARSVDHARPVWRTSTRLVCGAPVEGQLPWQAALDTAAARHLIAAWPVAFEGRGATVSVVRSGEDRPASDSPRLDGNLLDVDVETGAVRTLGRGAYIALTPSPGGARVAAARATHMLRPTADGPVAQRQSRSL